MPFSTLLPRSLFARTALTLALVFVVFQAASFWVVTRTLIVPVAERSADDLAGLIVLSAQTWVELPPLTRPAFEAELARRHGLRLTLNNIGATADAPDFAFRDQIAAALSRRLGDTIRLRGVPGKNAAWLEIPLGGYVLRAGFFPDRYAVQPPLAAIAVFALGAILSLVTAVLLVRRITVPLARAAVAARQIGAGERPEPLPETGPDELVHLARRFNIMASEVRELLENRTTLLGGISHDLRTPMTRLQLQIEMLRPEPDDVSAKSAANEQRIAKCLVDLTDMNAIIAGYLELARATRAEPPQGVDLGEMLTALAAESGARYRGLAHCRVKAGAVALKQIVANLLSNAQRYGNKDGGNKGGGHQGSGEGSSEPVELALDCTARTAHIYVRDRGAGIPPDQLEKVFRPFYRVEASRAAATGGTGLGLALVRQLAAANGWTVRLTNREGGGLEARLDVPRR